MRFRSVIEGFFDHQYLEKDSVNVLDFFHRDIVTKTKKLRRVLLLLGFGQPCPAMVKLGVQSHIDFSHSCVIRTQKSWPTHPAIYASTYCNILLCVNLSVCLILDIGSRPSVYFTELEHLKCCSSHQLNPVKGTQW